MKVLEKALFIVCAGKTMKSLMETGEKSAMETVMLGDRIRNSANSSLWRRTWVLKTLF
jgi:NAD(P)H dehydrogenase (quinone)